MPRTFLRSIIYVELNDGRRAISGTLACMDNEGNIILHEATEHTLGAVSYTHLRAHET